MQFDQRTGKRIRALLLATHPGLIGLAALASASGVCAEVQFAEAAMTCENLASGWSWQIRIDYARSTVDSSPAHISEAKISWYDPADGGNYTLDRASGNLTVVVASSTGGYFLHHRCKLQN